MKSLKIFLFLGVGIVLFLGAQAWADVPRLINFQGRLTDGSGTPVKDSTYSVLFTIYDDSAAGTNLWSETQSVVTKGGTFNVNLGSATALPDTIFDDTTRYLAIKVGTDPEMTPRQRMVSMAYGYRVRTVDGATGGTISGNTAIQSDLTVSGNVGIGTTSPSAKLDVNGAVKFSSVSGDISMAANSWLRFGSAIAVSGDGTNTFVDNNGGYIAFRSGFIERMRMTSAGNVGIGTTSPGDKLEVGASGNILLKASADDPGDIIFRTSTGTEKGRVWSDPAVGSNKLFLRGGSTTTGIVIDSAGKVGIGTTAPNEQLELTGNLRLPATTGTTGIIKVGTNRFIHSYGNGNAFMGVNAGNLTMTGSFNTVSGYYALSSNTTGNNNIAIGSGALYFNTAGNCNTANGNYALYYNTTGYSNTADGYMALYSNTTGYRNSAYGDSALFSNTTGNYNTAIGRRALYGNTTGNYNTAVGYGADVYLGRGTLNNATAIGWGAIVYFSNSVSIGNSAVTSIGGYVGWSNFSDARLKTNVRRSPLGLDFILKLNPITYNSLSPGQEGITYTGLIAQEVEKVLQELGADFSGLDKPKNKDGYYQLRYAEFVMPLIKAVQELNARNETLEARLAELEALVKSLAANPSTPNQFNSYEAGAGVTK